MARASIADDVSSAMSNFELISTRRLCFLTFDSGTPQSSRFDPLFQGLRDLGYVDGQTITIDYLSAGASQAVGFPALHRRNHYPGRSGGEECTHSATLRRPALSPALLDPEEMSPGRR